GSERGKRWDPDRGRRGGAAPVGIQVVEELEDELLSLWPTRTRRTSRVLSASLTVARIAPSFFAMTARPKAAPGGSEIESWSTNWPRGVNSTISLGWLLSGLTASPLAVRRSPLGAKARPRGPCRWVSS